MNVIVGPEWDDALQICAEYFDSTAGDDPASIAKTLNEIAESICPAKVGITHIVQEERNTGEISADCPDILPGETEAGGEPEESVTEQVAAEPSVGNGGAKQNCPGGNCSAWPAYRWGWWW